MDCPDNMGEHAWTAPLNPCTSLKYGDKNFHLYSFLSLTQHITYTVIIPDLILSQLPHPFPSTTNNSIPNRYIVKVELIELIDELHSESEKQGSRMTSSIQLSN
jgi:hypothetical protein